MKVYEIIQVYEGYVVEIYDSSFFCQLVDLTNPNEPELVAEISKEYVSNEDVEFFKLGSIFILWIGFNSVTDESTSELYFYKEVWTKEDIEKIKIEAKVLCSFFDR